MIHAAISIDSFISSMYRYIRMRRLMDDVFLSFLDQLHLFGIIITFVGSMITIDGHDSTIVSSVENLESLIYYNNYITFPSVVDSIPKLIVRNVTIESFVSYFNDGGAMSFYGDIDLSLFAITFKDDYSIYSGGALSINNNSYHSTISHCVFEGCYSSGMMIIIIKLFL